MKHSTALLLLLVLGIAAGKAQMPVITSFSPSSSGYPFKVKIYGSNFSATQANNVVRFGGIMPQLLSAWTESLSVAVPVNPTYGPITVTVAGKTAYHWKPFFTTFGGGGFTASSWVVPVALGVNSNSQTMAYADIDGDGKLDIILPQNSGNAVRVARNTTTTGGAFTFGTPVDFGTTFIGPRAIATGDLDGDGKLDIAVASQGAASPGRLSVFRNTSTPGAITSSSFAAVVNFRDTTDFLYIPYGVDIADFDDDGRPDIVTVGQLSSGYWMHVFRNASSVGSITAGSFEPPVKVAAGDNARQVKAADIDGDGKVDAVVITQIAGSVVASVYRNTTVQAAISFASPVNVTLPSTGVGQLSLGDMNADGKPDIVSSAASAGPGTVSIFQNSSTAGTVSFGQEVSLALPEYGIQSLIADVDGDARPDIAVIGQTVVSIFRNLNRGGNITTQSFVPRVDLTGFSSAVTLSFAIADIDGDAKPEITVGSYSSQQLPVVVLKNRMATGFTPDPISTGTTADIAGVSFITRDRGCLGGRGGIIRVTTDGGTTWTGGTSGTTSDINRIRLVGGKGFYVGSGGLIGRSTDGGGTWTPFSTGTTETFNGASFTDENTGWAVGTNGTIHRYNGSGWVGQTSGTTVELKGIYGIGSTGFAVGAGGTILRWSGSAWVPQTSGTPGVTLTDVAFASDQIGYVVGTGGTILKTTNSGTAWVSLNSGLGSVNIRSIKLADANIAWVVGDGGFIAQTSDGGATWGVSGLGVTDDMLGVEFVQGQGVIVGKAGRGFKFSTTLVSVREDHSIASRPAEFALQQNYPNPFNPTTNIRFTLANSGFTSLKVYDVLGREVATLMQENMKAGRYEATFNAEGFASGIYFYRLRSDNAVQSKKMILLK